MFSSKLITGTLFYTLIVSPMRTACRPILRIHPLERFPQNRFLASSEPTSRASHRCPIVRPHAYTSGHWLSRDEEQRNARFIGFDFDQLRRRVIEICRGATAITSCRKHEGGFNRVFIFTLDHNQRVVARLPTQIAGPPKLTTNSEVATIEYREFI